MRRFAGAGCAAAGVSGGDSTGCPSSRACLRARPRALMLMMPDSPFGFSHAAQAARGSAPLATISTARLTASFFAGRPEGMVCARVRVNRYCNALNYNHVESSCRAAARTRMLCAMMSWVDQGYHPSVCTRMGTEVCTACCRALARRGDCQHPRSSKGDGI